MTASRRMSREERQAAVKYLRATNKKQPDILLPVPIDEWPERVLNHQSPPSSVWRSKKYLVQVFRESNAVRLSVNRAAILADGNWDDGLSWDELQQIKREIGYGDYWAFECFPSDDEVVNVANMRHLWIPDEIPDFGWYRDA